MLVRPVGAIGSRLLMRTAIDHLPEWKQRELREVVRIVLDRFEEAHTRQATQWKKKGRIHKIIMMGSHSRDSHARGTWVYEPHTKKGYCSDFDLVIVVNQKLVSEHDKFWNWLSDYFFKAFDSPDRWLKTPVSLKPHAKQQLYNSIVEGRYFYIDLLRDGIILYEDDDSPLPVPGPKTPERNLMLANEYYSERFKSAAEFYDDYEGNLKKDRLEKSAFELNQCVEQLYNAALLTKTLYIPKVHNIIYLRRRADTLDKRFLHVWTEDTRWQRSAYNVLKDAYVKARYHKNVYKITKEQLLWLGERARDLANIVKDVCTEEIARLENQVRRNAIGRDESL